MIFEGAVPLKAFFLMTTAELPVEFLMNLRYLTQLVFYYAGYRVSRVKPPNHRLDPTAAGQR